MLRPPTRPTRPKKSVERDSSVLIELLPIALFTFVVMAIFIAMLVRSFQIVRPGTALVASGKSGEPRVFLTGGALRRPGVQLCDVDLSPRSILVRRDGDHPLCFAGGDPADVVAIFQLRVNPTTDDVKKALEAHGPVRLGDEAALAAHLSPKLESALEGVAAAVDLQGITKARFVDEVLAAVGPELDGLHLDDVTIERLEPRKAA